MLQSAIEAVRESIRLASVLDAALAGVLANSLQLVLRSCAVTDYAGSGGKG